MVQVLDFPPSPPPSSPPAAVKNNKRNEAVGVTSYVMYVRSPKAMISTRYPTYTCFQP